MTDDTTTSTPASKPADIGKHEASGVTGVNDRVVMASRLPDGTPAQSPDFVFIGDKDAATEGAVHQLQSVAYAGLQTSLDPDVSPTDDEQQAAADAAKSQAEAEVEQRHEDTTS